MTCLQHPTRATWLLVAGLAAFLTAGCAVVSKQPDVTNSSSPSVIVPWTKWQIECTPLGDDRIRILLRKHPLTSGGDGDAWQVFSGRAEQLVRDGGYVGYTVLAYTEGVDSNSLVAQRVSQGLIHLNR